MPIRKTRLLNPKQPGSSHFIYFNCLLDTVRITLPSRFAPSLDKLAAIYDVTEKRDVVTFMTKDIESVWSSLQAQGCRISDIEIQNKTLLDSLFDSTREGKS